MKAYEYLINSALEQGCTISVESDGIVDLSKSSSAADIVEAVEAVDEAVLVIRKDNKRMGWAQVSAYGLEDDETVMDFGCNDFMDKINNDYSEKYYVE